MEARKLKEREIFGRGGFVGPIFVLWSLAFIIGASLLLTNENSRASFGGNYLVVSALIAGAIILTPTYLEYRAGRFDPFHPLTFAAWSYLFPAFSIGGIVLAFGLNQPYFLSFIDSPEYTLPLSLAYVCLGFVSMCVGFYVPWSARTARFIDERLPAWEWDSPGIWMGGLVLLLMGLALNIIGFLSGLLGFQRVDRTGLFDAVIVFLALFFLEGTILLWMAFFRQEKGKPLVSYLILLFLISLIPIRLAFLGSRAELVAATMSVAIAFNYSGRKLKRVHGIVFAGVMLIALAVGVIWATTFRNVKGSEARISSGDYVGQIVATADYLSKTDSGRIAQENFGALLERVENLSSLAVVVSNYEKLAPYEEAYGIKDNIFNDALTAFVPRFIWTDKPSTSDPRAYGDLYFSFSENSFAITPFGDLLRNFGPWGIIPGMFIIGFYLQLIYGVLIKSDRPALWKKMIYFPLLTVVSYEAFYSIFVPSVLRVLFVVVISVLLLQFLIGRRAPSSNAS